MTQPRRYKNDADKQAAYRARRPKPMTQAHLAILAREIYATIRKADVYAKSPLPDAILAQDQEQTLRNLICFLDPVKDTIRHPNWNLLHPERANEPDIFDRPEGEPPAKNETANRTRKKRSAK
jgi:hypothetical protein